MTGRLLCQQPFIRWLTATRPPFAGQHSAPLPGGGIFERHLDKPPEVRGHSPGKNAADTIKVTYLHSVVYVSTVRQRTTKFSNGLSVCIFTDRAPLSLIFR